MELATLVATLLKNDRKLFSDGVANAWSWRLFLKTKEHYFQMAPRTVKWFEYDRNSSHGIGNSYRDSSWKRKNAIFRWRRECIELATLLKNERTLFSDGVTNASSWRLFSKTKERRLQMALLTVKLFEFGLKLHNRYEGKINVCW